LQIYLLFGAVLCLKVSTTYCKYSLFNLQEDPN
jgi:hypothetical protein